MIAPVLLLFMGLQACSGPAAPSLQGQALHLYSFAEYLPRDLVSGYEKATGVQVTLETYASNEEMADGLRSKPGWYDLIIPSDYAVDALAKAGDLTPLDLARVPNWDNIDPRFLSPYFDPGGATKGRKPSTTGNAKYSLPFQWGTTGIAYDPEKVNPPPAKWSDLWRPELAGHVVLLDDPREMLGLTLLSLGYTKNETDPAKIAEAAAKLKPLVQSAVALDSDAPEARLVSGEAWIGAVYNGNAALATRQKPGISWVFPEEGAGIWFDNLCIPKGAPNPGPAYAFIEWALRPENSALVTREFPYSNPNKEALTWLEQNDATAYAAYQGNPATNPAPEILADAKLVKNVGPEATALYDRAWADLVATRKETP